MSTTHVASRRRVSTRTVLLVGLLVALVMAGVVSYYASASPDGLNRVAGDLGFSGAQQASSTQDGPLAGYDVGGLGTRWSGGLAGVIGCAVVLATTYGLMLLRKRSTSTARPDGGE